MLDDANWRRRWAIGSLTAAAVAAVLISACGGGGSTPGQAATPTVAANTAVPTGATSSNLIKSALEDGLGLIITDANGFMLYHLSSDSGIGTGCTGDCLTNWPPLLISGAPQAGPGVNANMLATISRPEGTQVTYNGITLYRFTADKAPGEARGQGVIAFGGKWNAITTAGVVTLAAPRSTIPATSAP